MNPQVNPANRVFERHRLLVGEALALGSALATHQVLARRRGGATIRQVSAWVKAFRRDCPRGHDVYVRVKLASGAVYSGRLADYTADSEVGARELMLARPLAFKKDSGEFSPLPKLYQRVVLQGDIEIVAVSYWPTDVPRPGAAADDESIVIAQSAAGTKKQAELQQLVSTVMKSHPDRGHRRHLSAGEFYPAVIRGGTREPGI